MICSLKFKKDVLILKMLLCLGFCAFGFEAIYTIQVVISLPLWIEPTMDQLLLLFPVIPPVIAPTVASFYRQRYPTNLFSLLLIDLFWLFSKL